MNRQKVLKVLTAAVCFLVLILDSKTAIEGAKSGISLCINSIIPALFPFCVLSKLICSSLLGSNIPMFSKLGKALGMPDGTESIFLLSLLGGYPIGAQCIDDAYKNGSITKTDAARLLGFCNNAGPAFLFGIASHLFPTLRPIWYLFFIHILSAIFVGLLIPGKSDYTCKIKPNGNITLIQAIEESIKTMSLVCSWIIIFKIILSFISAWFSWILNESTYATLAGLLELSNGCFALRAVSNLGLRYILCALFLSFGGGCVALQTLSVTKHCGIGVYFPGKILQASFSILLSVLSQFWIFTRNDICPSAGNILLSGIVLGAFSLFLLRKTKKVVAFAK